MQIIALRLSEELEVERYMRESKQPSPAEQRFPAFPFITYTLDFDSFWEDQVPWHWHRTLEIIEVISGRLQVKSSRSSCILSAGELCYINLHILHQLSPVPMNSHCEIRLYLFHPDLISGNWGNAFDTNYVSPIVNRRDIDLYHLSADSPLLPEFKTHLSAALDAFHAETYAYEFDIRHHMTQIWTSLYRALEPQVLKPRAFSTRNDERMQTMLMFIQQNFASAIDLSDIAASASVSERECFRCFHQLLGITPIRYLQHYRVRIAARMLLETDLSIQSISEKTGFHDTSYFGRIFQRYMHSTPGKFRRDHQHLAR